MLDIQSVLERRKCLLLEIRVIATIHTTIMRFTTSDVTGLKRLSMLGTQMDVNIRAMSRTLT